MNPIIEEKEIPVKIVIVGAKSIGKTNLSYKFMKKNFVEEYNESKFINYDSKKINCLNKNLRLDIWDTVGKIINKFMSARLYGDANICLILFDLTNIKQLKEKYKIPYFEISCKNGRNIKELEYFICRSHIPNIRYESIGKLSLSRLSIRHYESNRVQNKCFIF